MLHVSCLGLANKTGPRVRTEEFHREGILVHMLLVNFVIEVNI